MRYRNRELTCHIKQKIITADIYIYINKNNRYRKSGKIDKKMYLERENKRENSSPTFTLMRMVIAKVLHVLENLRMLLIKCEWIGKVTTEIRKGNALAEQTNKGEMGVE